MTSISKSYSSLLQLYSRPQHLVEVKKLHGIILKTLHCNITFLFNSLITSYSKSNLPSYALKVFLQIPCRNLFSWNALLACSAKSGHLSEMLNIFNSMPEKDCISWNSVISGYASHGFPEKAIDTYKFMLREGYAMQNRITFSTMLIISSTVVSSILGIQVHCQGIKHGLGSHVFVGSPLVDMYSKIGLVSEAWLAFQEVKEKNLVIHNSMLMGFFRCGMVAKAKKLFARMREKDSISWTTMITGLTHNSFELEAIGLLKEMRYAGVTMDQYTFGSVLTACGALSALDHGKQIHAFIIRTHLDGNVFVGSALVDMYSKCRSIKLAESVFKGTKVKNLITWTTMLVGYGQNGCYEEAIVSFLQMQRHGIKPDDFTVGSAISSCANLASIEEGAQLHCQAIVLGLMPFITVSNALITLYGKCGNIEESHGLFDEMTTKDEISWTALVSGYAQIGKAKKTIELFERMMGNGVKPDGVTFIGVLSACSRAAMVEKGYYYFNSMINEHRISPIIDHYTCMIDLLSRAGRLEEAMNFIKRMPCRPDAIGWATLLSSCRVHGNIEMAKWAAESLIELDPQNPASYLLLLNMHASKRNWEEVAQIRKTMRDKGVKKEPGCSWIKYNNEIHIFSADDQSHSNSTEIYAELERLGLKMDEEGYMPDTSNVLHDVSEYEKRFMIGHHSEKLAIAFGLIFLPNEFPIRVFKNLRVCTDCHIATKIISKITGRDILVRDAVRFHKFSNGSCSCGDFW
ncbi:putative pentatricopeptide repeat-containing protein At1g68930 [Phalaenopsis equestris]|uniref:putative pentatricopeptide repeat-containing protein At1g68930 n=1 Tax=Phalaenopsis equestris TaxID=78828 RepID=UPI0009E5AA9F|nr:putative pentatricopeptide repeat-containing protein At1g68930 [Phalaenopsis equestris]XP_020578210.1 putative pentatricopeptide repeat-containing protein At1g68930 [Phalaenopsis equestris]